MAKKNKKKKKILKKKKVFKLKKSNKTKLKKSKKKIIKKKSKFKRIKIKKIKKSKKIKKNNKRKNFKKSKIRKVIKKNKIKKTKKIKKIKINQIKIDFFSILKEKILQYFRKLKLKFLIYLEKIKLKKTKKDLIKLEQLLKKEQSFEDKKLRDQDKLRLFLVKEIKKEERQKIYKLRDHLWKLSDRFGTIRDRYKQYREKIREQQLAELEVRRQSREEAKAVLDAQKAENALKQKLIERLERFSRNMKSIVFQINKRYITKKRSPLRFIDNIAESGECLIKNDDAPTDKDYLILLYVEGDTVEQRLVNPINLDDKTDLGSAKNFQPKNIFQASDYIIDRLALMFDKERKLKK